MDQPSTAANRRGDRQADAPPSPLDPYVATFVAWLATRARGVNINQLGAELAAATGWHPAFADAIVSAARSRGLLAPVIGRGRRTFSVGLSRRGQQFLDQHGPADASPPAAPAE